MLVEQVMVRDVLTLGPDETLRDALMLMQSRKIRHIPVVRDGELLGIVTDRDVKRAAPSLLGGVTHEEFDRVLNTTRVAQFMTREPLVAAPETPLRHAVKILVDAKVSALPVVRDGHLVGILTDTDLLRVLLSLLEG